MKLLQRRLFGDMRPLNSAGVITVEFAAALPVMILLLFGALEFGRLHVVSTMVERVMMDIAMECRFASGNVDLQGLVRTAVNDQLSPMLSMDDIKVSAQSASTLEDLTTSPASGTGGEGDTVRLEVKTTLGFLDWLRPDTFKTERNFVIYFVNELQ